jgi:hypothetical protein
MGFDPHSQSETTFSVYLNRQDNSGGSQLKGPYFPISWNGYPRLPNTNGGCERKTLIVRSQLFLTKLRNGWIMV